jgi:amino acid adenylation domain-containing protein
MGSTDSIGSGNGCGAGAAVIDAAATTPSARTIHGLFAHQARFAPNLLAVSDGAHDLTFAALDQRSNQIAHSLRAWGVHSGHVVATCLGHTPDFAACALAALKSGAAYLPLDPLNPDDRLEFMLRQSGARVLLTTAALARPALNGSWRTVPLDAYAGEISSCPSDQVSEQNDPDTCAYVIFTSGSTGTPKGVEVTHRNLLNLVGWHNHTFAVTPADRTSQVANLGFDAAVWELWPNLIAGASVHFAPEAARSSPEQMRDWLVARAITISFQPTPMAELMMRLPWPPETLLRYLLTGGDVLHDVPSPALPFKLVNNYGPTEATVVATSAVVEARPDARTVPSIGAAIENVTLAIVSPNLQPVADGEPGELCVGGAGVARGYLGQPELTAEKFVKLPAGRFYRTGDMARRLANGEIAFLGRLDDEIKIRGFRIQPAEIVRCLNTHPAVAASAVSARQFAGEMQLVAYIVPEPDAPVHLVSELQACVREGVPEYMVPKVFVKLAELPVGPNGKVERSRLPEPCDDNRLREGPVAAPRSVIEERVVEILVPMLGVPDVGVNDNFFLLGGHSLLGAQLIARLRERFGVELSLRSLFDKPRVADIAAEIERLLVAKVEGMSDEEAERMLKAAREAA